MFNPDATAHPSPEGRPSRLQVLDAPAVEHKFVYQYNAPKRVRVAPKFTRWNIAGIIFLIFAVLLLVAMHGTSAGIAMGVSFVSIVLEALPFVIIGSLVSGIIEVYVPKEAVARLLPKRKLLGVLAAASLGLFVPVCECAVIPFTRRLVRKGVPFSTAVAYLLAGPTVNVLTGASTLLAYHNPMAPGFAWHVLAAPWGLHISSPSRLLSSLTASFRGTPHCSIRRWRALRIPVDADTTMIMSTITTHGHDHSDHHDHGHNHDHNHDHDHDQHAHHQHDVRAKQMFAGRLAESINHAGDDFLEVGQFLIIGAFIAAICQTIIPREAFVTVARAPGVAILIMMGLAVALNLCSGANAFVAASFRGALPVSAQMGFMLLGPMLDTKLSAMYLSFITKRAFLTLLVLVYVFVFSTMIFWHYFSFVGGVR